MGIDYTDDGVFEEGSDGGCTTQTEKAVDDQAHGIMRSHSLSVLDGCAGSPGPHNSCEPDAAGLGSGRSRWWSLLDDSTELAACSGQLDGGEQKSEHLSPDLQLVEAGIQTRHEGDAQIESNAQVQATAGSGAGLDSSSRSGTGSGSGGGSADPKAQLTESEATAATNIAMVAAEQATAAAEVATAVTLEVGVEPAAALEATAAAEMALAAAEQATAAVEAAIAAAAEASAEPEATAVAEVAIAAAEQATAAAEVATAAAEQATAETAALAAARLIVAAAEVPDTDIGTTENDAVPVTLCSTNDPPETNASQCKEHASLVEDSVQEKWVNAHKEAEPMDDYMSRGLEASSKAPAQVAVDPSATEAAAGIIEAAAGAELNATTPPPHLRRQQQHQQW